MLDFDTADEELYTDCCCTRMKRSTIFRRVVSLIGVGPLVFLLQMVMGLSMVYSVSYMKWDMATFCSQCNLGYGTDLTATSTEEQTYNYRCLNNVIDSLMWDEFGKFMSALVSSLAAHVVVMYSIIIDRKVNEDVIARGFGRASNRYFLYAHIALFLDLGLEIADVIFIHQAVWGGGAEPTQSEDSYIFNPEDGYNSCSAKEVTEVADLLTLLGGATTFILYERLVCAVLIVIFVHIGNSQSLKPSPSDLKKYVSPDGSPSKNTRVNVPKDPVEFSMI